MIDRVYINYDRYIAKVMMIIITIIAFKNMNIITMITLKSINMIVEIQVT